eukprot:COSAG03_NODE_21954_length_297_cov_0.772727_1_plen_54_part_01
MLVVCLLAVLCSSLGAASAAGMPNGTGNTVMFAPYTLCARLLDAALSVRRLGVC